MFLFLIFMRIQIIFVREFNFDSRICTSQERCLENTKIIILVILNAR
jgi:hypothetical protein